MSQPSVASSVKQPKWQYSLSPSFLVNWAAISDDASRVVADTYYFPYPGTPTPPGTNTHGTFGTFCYDSTGKLLWSDKFEGDEGIFSVAISGDGRIAAAGGLFSGGAYGDRPDSGVLRAYDAGDGRCLLDYTLIRRRVNSMALSADGAVLAAVSANKLYVFAQNSKGKFPVDPAIPVGGGQFLDCVAVHPGGQWLAACDRGGFVYLITVANGTVQQTYSWRAPVSIPLLSVAISKASESFVVGGGNIVYVFTKDSMIKGTGPIAQYTPPETPPGVGNQQPSAKQQNVRWVAISDDGAFVTAVENQTQTAGLLRALSLSRGQLSLAPAWATNPIPLNHNPNSTSMDLAARYVTVSDGNPVGTPGTFYLFDAKNGNKLWEFVTTNMNWPMFISADGSAITAGSDNGNLYYFEP